ncbi:hypothetical protein, partial [Inquilinus sp. OTU3971]|uniref:hypothetical protein n=1 Tax=Inquilinus sp. OTU3971 TaxID=3043855 RepID=UPI00313C4A19
ANYLNLLPEIRLLRHLGQPGLGMQLKIWPGQCSVGLLMLASARESKTEFARLEACAPEARP